MTVQGRYELYFVLKNNKLNLIRSKPIKTPFGLYTPDFELENEFIEIKSGYTFKKSAREGQLKKIKWIQQNIKKVRIIILKESTVTNFLKNIDTNKFLFKNI